MNEFEEKRHQELIEVSERQVDAIDRMRQEQVEVAARAHQESMERAHEQFRALDRIASLQEAQIWQDREHRLTEELRSCLRAGLLEFPETFQAIWLQLNERLSSIQAYESQ